jgi:hypothetical protein
MPLCQLLIVNWSCPRCASLVNHAIQKTNNMDVVKQQFAVLWSIKLAPKQMYTTLQTIPMKTPSALLSSNSMVLLKPLEIKMSVVAPNISTKLVLVLPVASMVRVMMNPLAKWSGSRFQSSGSWVHIPSSGPVCHVLVNPNPYGTG